MRNYYPFLRKTAICIAVWTSVPAFGTPLPAGGPAGEKSLNYQSPLAKAIALENELTVYAADPSSRTANAIQPRSANCINGTVGFNSNNLTNGFSFKPYPSVNVTLGRFQGQLRATGRYCFNGDWRANGGGGITAKNEATVGLFFPSGGDGWRYFENGSYRFKLEFGIKGNGDLGGYGAFDFQGSGFAYEYAKIVAGVRADFGVSFYTPKLTIQKRYWSGGQYNWFQLPIYAPTNGQYVDGVAFELSAYGSLVLTGQYEWQCWDNDPDSSRDSEQRRLSGSIVGQAGVKAKFKLSSGRESEFSIYWSRAYASGGATIDSGYGYDPVNGATDYELDKRPQ